MPRIYKKKNRKCSYVECDRSHYVHGYCKPHSRRAENGTDMNKPFKRGNGLGELTAQGYIYLTINGVQKMQHRLIVENYLGRLLTDDENIHHKNGNRSDNRLENLEIWSVKQPAGQRIEDKIKYAKEILQQYDSGNERWKLF